MQLTRYYEKQPIDMGQIRAIRDVLTSSLNWRLRSASYCLYYESEFYSVNGIDEAVSIAGRKGQPAHVRVSFTSEGGRTFSIETRLRRGISVDVDNLSDPPEKVFEAIEPVLSLTKYGDVPRGRIIASAFIAHGFDDESQGYANEVARFLALLGIRCYSGRSFAPTKVTVKVKERLAKHDVFIAIVTPQEDDTWITQEMATAAAWAKDLFILKQANVKLKEGILGDHEYISFPGKNISRTFIPMLEGLNELCGIEPGTTPFGIVKSGIELMEGNV